MELLRLIDADLAELERYETVRRRKIGALITAGVLAVLGVAVGLWWYL